VIVVVGNPVLRKPARPADDLALAGVAALTAVAAARAGSEVQLVGRTGDDPDGDALVHALASARVQHVALLRVAGRPTAVVAEDAADEEPTSAAVVPAEGSVPAPAGGGPGLEAADVDLALRYLTDFRVLVVAPDVPADAVALAVRAAGWTSATPIVLATPTAVVGNLPPEAIVLAAPPDDPDGVFAGLIGEYAAALDRGEDAGTSFRDLVGRLGWETAAVD
jgi:hypothetical protein